MTDWPNYSLGIELISDRQSVIKGESPDTEISAEELGLKIPPERACVRHLFVGLHRAAEMGFLESQDALAPCHAAHELACPVRAGKINRQAPPDSGNSGSNLETDFIAPKIMIEEQLSRIWTEVLALEQIGNYDNFFDLGGHSLAATGARSV